MNNCKTCKHWKGMYPGVAPNEIGICDLTHSSNAVPVTPGTLAFAIDCEGYGAELRTKPDFGCVQWEGQP